jgi:hypothetical protein
MGNDTNELKTRVSNNGGKKLPTNTKPIQGNKLDTKNNIFICDMLK